MEQLLARPHVRTTGEGEAFWRRFREVVDDALPSGNLVPDAHLIALMLEQAVNLRFLYGTRLERGAGILRPGSSHLANLDLVPGVPLDADLVRGLVREAVARHPAFVAAERSGEG